jgi:hypothetical protein
MIVKIVRESLSEGVGDKYAEEKYGIPDTDREWERKYAEYELHKGMEVIAQEGDWKLLKNPKSIKLTSPSSRGVIDQDGNLYIENKSEKIHHDLLRILFEKDILKGKFTKAWNRQLPTETGFLTVQRFKNTPHIAIGESNRLIYDADDFSKYLSHYQKFIESAKKKNPKLSFQTKLVGMKFANLKKNSNLHEDLSYFQNRRDHFMKD